MNFGKFLVIVFISVVSCILVCGIVFYFLVSDVFAPQRRMVKEIKYNGQVLQWYAVDGILDQNFPDVVELKCESDLDTIVRAYNVANVDVVGSEIILSFYGKPQLVDSINSLPKDYIITVDTSLVKNGIK